MVLSPVTEPPRALWVLPVADLAGVARHVADVAAAGLPGWELSVLLPDGPAAEVLRTTPAEVLTAPIGPQHGLRRSVAAYRSALRRVRPALVHSHLAHADTVVALATPARVPLVSTEHGIADDDLVYHGSPARSAAMARAHRLRVRRLAAFVAVSAATLAAARRKWRLPAALPQPVIRNGVDPLPRAERPGLHVVSLARLAPEKRIPDLLAGFARVARTRPEARLTVAGTGPLAAELRQRAEVLGIASRVSFPGFAEPTELLARADVVAQLSVWENCSYTLLDGVACGLGVVASPVGGNPELLPPHCLVDPADHDAVAEALVDQGTDPARRPELPAGWPDVATMTKELAETYAEVVGPGRAP